MQKNHKNIVVPENIFSVRLDNFLVTQLNITKSQVNKLITNKLVTVNQIVATKNGLLVNQFDTISIYNNLDTNYQSHTESVSSTNFSDLKVNIIYEDNYCLVIDKPNNVLVYPTQFNEPNTLSHWLQNYFNSHGIHEFDDDLRKGIVHRLDRQTTGLLLVAKSKHAYLRFSEMLKNNEIVRKYTCLVHNCFNLETRNFRIETNIGRSYQDKYRMQVNASKDAKPAITNVSVLQNIANYYAMVECDLVTGRTHQVRVHMRYINHPVVNDPLYGIDKKPTEYGQYLFCSTISFSHPFLKQNINLVLDLPPEFVSKITSLKHYE